MNEEYEVALLIDNVEEKSIVNAINTLLNDKELYKKLQHNCKIAREKYNWHEEEKKLIQFYKNIFE